MKKILIIEDLEHFREKYTTLAKSDKVKVFSAKDFNEGIEMIDQHKPEFIITDKDLPDGSGNDIATYVKKEYDARIVGITGGNPSDFNEYIDLKLSKSITDDEYISLIQRLVSGDQSYFQKKNFEDMVNGIIIEYIPIDILVQGYMLGKDINEGKMKFDNAMYRKPSSKELSDLFSIEELEINPKDMYLNSRVKVMDSLSQEKIQGDRYDTLNEFFNNDSIYSFLTDLQEKNIFEIEEKKEYEIFHEKFIKIEYKK